MRGLALFILATGTVVAGAGAPPKKTADANPGIAKIEAKYEAIKKLEPKLKRAEFESAASAVAYRDRGVVKEIREEDSDETGRREYFFFYDKDKVFFVIEWRTNVAQPMMTEMEGLPKPMEDEVEFRYYIEGGRLIRWLEGKKEIKPGSDRFGKRESEIIDLAADAMENAN